MVPSGRTTGRAAAAAAAASRTVEDELAQPILLAERVRKAAEEAESCKSECFELGKLADALAQNLRAAARLATANPSLYDRPIRRVALECSKSLDRALSLSRRCRHGRGLLRRVVTIVSSTDFRKAAVFLEASLADTKWLLSVYSTALGASGGSSSFDGGSGGGGGEIVLSLPPIASTDPILSWVWSYIAMVIHGGSAPSDRVDAAAALANLALDNDRNKKIIMEEGGMPPLLALLKDSSSIDAQLAAAVALTNLATCLDGVSAILSELAVPTIIQVLSDSPMKLQICVARLVSAMASMDPAAQEEFARENAIRPLVTLLLFELPIDEPKQAPKKATSIHSLVQINRELESRGQQRPDRTGSGGGGGGSSRASSLSVWSLDSHRRKERERERESPEVKLSLKIACADALWRLSRGNISNSRKITETKGLLCLAKLIEIEKGELQMNCLMALLEICAAAESDADLRRSAFKMNSPAAKLVVNQLIRVAQEVNAPILQVPAIKSIGYLARTFPARETRVIAPLVAQLGHWNSEVAAEAAISLGKFASPDNFLCAEHSKAIIEFEGVPPLMRLLRSSDKAQLHSLTLLCYLALHVGDSEALERAKALAALEMATRTTVAQSQSLRDLLPRAIRHLELYHAGIHPHRQPYVP